MEVIVGETEPLARALKRFRRQVIRSGLFRELRNRRQYEKPSIKKRRKSKEAVRRRARMRRREQQDWFP